MAAKWHIRRRSMLLGAAATAAVGQYSSIGYAQEERLASWNDGAAKQAILDFVRTTTSQVPPEDRIATFDQDGTLWVSHPCLRAGDVRARPGARAGAATSGLEE